MRKLKFRAWDTRRNIMYCMDDPNNYDYYFDICNDSFCFHSFVDEDGNQETTHEMEPITVCLGKDNIMQYTGLKDKNGKEIYEGDIVELEELTEPIRYRGTYWKLKRYAVEYKDQRYIPENLDESVVIGNIFENPELLEVK